MNELYFFLLGIVVTLVLGLAIWAALKVTEHDHRNRKQVNLIREFLKD